MGLYCEFDVVADFGFLDETEEYGIVPDYSEGCEIFAEAFLKYSHQLVPVDTGYLRSTLNAGGGDTSCYAETDCDYAQYVEYGTVYMGEQPYFTPALAMALMEAEPAWREAEEQALMEEQILIEEEEMEQQAQALAAQQSQHNGMMQMMASQGKGPEIFGGLNFSSPAALIGSILGTFISAVIITTVQAMVGIDKDFSGISSKAREGSSGGSVFVPEVLIT